MHTCLLKVKILHGRSTEPSPARESGLLEAFFLYFFDPCGRDFMVSQIGPNAPYLLLTDHFEPIRDTLKSTVAATGIEKN